MHTNAAWFERNFRELTAETSVNFVFIGLEQHLHIIRSDYIAEGEGVTTKVCPLGSYITARQCIPASIVTQIFAFVPSEKRLAEKLVNMDTE